MTEWFAMVDDSYTTYLLREFRDAGLKERGSRENKDGGELASFKVCLEKFTNALTCQKRDSKW